MYYKIRTPSNRVDYNWQTFWIGVGITLVIIVVISIGDPHWRQPYQEAPTAEPLVAEVAHTE